MFRIFIFISTHQQFPVVGETNEVTKQPLYGSAHHTPCQSERRRRHTFSVCARFCFLNIGWATSNDHARPPPPLKHQPGREGNQSTAEGREVGPTAGCWLKSVCGCLQQDQFCHRMQIYQHWETRREPTRRQIPPLAATHFESVRTAVAVSYRMEWHSPAYCFGLAEGACRSCLHTTNSGHRGHKEIDDRRIDMPQEADLCRGRVRRLAGWLMLRDSVPKAVEFRGGSNYTGARTTPHTHPSVLKAIAMVDFVGASPWDRSRYSSCGRNTLSSSAQSSTPLALPVALRPFSTRKRERELFSPRERASCLMDRCMAPAPTTAAATLRVPESRQQPTRVKKQTGDLLSTAASSSLGGAPPIVRSRMAETGG